MLRTRANKATVRRRQAGRTCTKNRQTGAVAHPPLRISAEPLPTRGRFVIEAGRRREEGQRKAESNQRSRKQTWLNQWSKVSTLLKMVGRRKLSRAHSSGRLFCGGGKAQKTTIQSHVWGATGRNRAALKQGPFVFHSSSNSEAVGNNTYLAAATRNPHTLHFPSQAKQAQPRAARRK